MYLSDYGPTVICISSYSITVTHIFHHFFRLPNYRNLYFSNYLTTVTCISHVNYSITVTDIFQVTQLQYLDMSVIARGSFVT